MSNRYPKGWAFKQVMPIILMWLLCGPTPLCMFIMTSKAKKDSWTNIAGMSLLIFILAICLMFTGDDTKVGIGGLTIVLLWIFTFLFVVVNIPEFLRLAAANQNITVTSPSKRSKPAEPKREPVANKIGKGEQLISDLRKWKTEVEPELLRADIDQLINLSEIVLKKKGVDRDLFFSRYDAPLNTLLQKYDEIENTRLNTNDMVETMISIESTIRDTVKAMKKDISNMYKADMQDINAETSIFLRELKKKGLLEE